MEKEGTTPRVSVIVPVYNVRTFLETAIESIRGQSLKELEILLIDDGSTDGSGAVCDAYAAKDKRVRVIHKQNDGLGRAIDTGVDEATGEYVGIVEPDDRIAPDMYEKLYERAEELNVDVLKCGFYCCANGKTTDSTSIYAVAEDGEVFDIRQKPKLLMSAGNWWNGVYKRRFLQENHIRNIYSPGASYQDFSWMASTLSQAKRISILHRALYYYNVENPDASIKASGEKAFYIMHHCLEANRILREKGLFAHVREEIGVHEFKTCLSRDGYLRKDLRPAFFERFREVVTDLCREGGMRFRYLLPNEKLLLFALKHGHRRLFFAIVDSGAYRGIVRLKRWMKQTSVAQLYFRLRMR